MAKMPSNFMLFKEIMRKQAREYAFKLIFEYLFLQSREQGMLRQMLDTAEPDKLLSQIVPTDLTKADINYIDNVYTGVIDNFDSLYNGISALSEDFKAERIFKADLAALLLAMYEINYMDDIPDVVSINEAVEIAKRYSTDKSHIFVNGILAAYIKSKKQKES